MKLIYVTYLSFKLPSYPFSFCKLNFYFFNTIPSYKWFHVKWDFVRIWLVRERKKWQKLKTFPFKLSRYLLFMIMDCLFSLIVSFTRYNQAKKNSLLTTSIFSNISHCTRLLQFYFKHIIVLVGCISCFTFLIRRNFSAELPFIVLVSCLVTILQISYCYCQIVARCWAIRSVVI